MFMRNAGLCTEPVTKMDDVIFRRYCYLHIFTNRDSITMKDLLETAFMHSFEGTFSWIIAYNIFP